VPVERDNGIFLKPEIKIIAFGIVWDRIISEIM
jgi:hypothetical protein